MATTVIGIQEQGSLEGAVEALRKPGALVVLPTETLYGFSARASDAASLERVNRAKDRQAQGFVALAADITQVQRYVPVETSPEAIGWLSDVWPAALSAILSVDQPAAWGRGSVDSGWTAAFRVPTHPWLRELVGKLGEPILSTSVNRSGAPPLTQCAEIVSQFGEQVDLVIEDPGLESADANRLPSTLVDCTQWPPLLLRQGAYRFEMPER